MPRNILARFSDRSIPHKYAGRRRPNAGHEKKRCDLPIDVRQFLTRIEHRPACRHIADEQSDQNAEEEERRAEVSRAEVKVGMNKVNSDAGSKHAPAATIASVRVDKSNKTERKHPSQCPKPAVGIGREQRG
jgi:hypothetical protein